METQHASLRRKKGEKIETNQTERSQSLQPDMTGVSPRPLSMVVPSQSDANSLALSPSSGSLSRGVSHISYINKFLLTQIYIILQKVILLSHTVFENK